MICARSSRLRPPNTSLRSKGWSCCPLRKAAAQPAHGSYVASRWKKSPMRRRSRARSPLDASITEHVPPSDFRPSDTGETSPLPPPARILPRLSCRVNAHAQRRSRMIRYPSWDVAEAPRPPWEVEGAVKALGRKFLSRVVLSPRRYPRRQALPLIVGENQRVGRPTAWTKTGYGLLCSPTSCSKPSATASPLFQVRFDKVQRDLCPAAIPTSQGLPGGGKLEARGKFFFRNEKILLKGVPMGRSHPTAQDPVSPVDKSSSPT